MTVSYDVAHWRFWAAMDAMESLFFDDDECGGLRGAMDSYRWRVENAEPPVYWCKPPRSPNSIDGIFANRYAPMLDKIIASDAALLEMTR